MSETVIPLNHGYELCCESADDNPKGTNYVRVIDKNGEEEVYWDSQEWKDEPEVVMGAIMGMLNKCQGGL